MPLILHAFKVLIIEEDNWYYINSFTSTEQRSSISFKASDWPIVTILRSHWLMTSSPRQYLRCVMQLLQYTVQILYTIHSGCLWAAQSVIDHQAKKQLTFLLKKINWIIIVLVTFNEWHLVWPMKISCYNQLSYDLGDNKFCWSWQRLCKSGKLSNK